MTPAEAKQFWADLIAEDAGKALEIAKACPNVIRPWIKWRMDQTDMHDREYRGADGPAAARVLHKKRGLFLANVGRAGIGRFETLTEAKSACDAKLRELGYLLEE